jgi:hypothetical protein
MTDRTNELREQRPERRDVLLWIAVLAGPFAWGLTEQISYMIAPTACWLGRPVLLYIVPLATLLITGAGALIARRRWHHEAEGSTEKGDFQESRRRFMAAAGFWMCVAFAVAILATATPPLILRVCD